MKNKERQGKRLFLFAIVLTLVVSLVPLSGVNAQRVAPTSATSMTTAPAARAIQSKTVKTQMAVSHNGTRSFKYVQKISWEYNGKKIISYKATMKGLVYKPDQDVFYMGSVVWNRNGGVGSDHYYQVSVGYFAWFPTRTRYEIHIAHTVEADGKWSSGRGTYTYTLVDF